MLEALGLRFEAKDYRLKTNVFDRGYVFVQDIQEKYIGCVSIIFNHQKNQ